MGATSPVSEQNLVKEITRRTFKKMVLETINAAVEIAEERNRAYKEFVSPIAPAPRSSSQPVPTAVSNLKRSRQRNNSTNSASSDSDMKKTKVVLHSKKNLIKHFTTASHGIRQEIPIISFL